MLRPRARPRGHRPGLFRRRVRHAPSSAVHRPPSVVRWPGSPSPAVPIGLSRRRPAVLSPPVVVAPRAAPIRVGSLRARSSAARWLWRAQRCSAGLAVLVGVLRWRTRVDCSLGLLRFAGVGAVAGRCARRRTASAREQRTTADASSLQVVMSRRCVASYQRADVRTRAAPRAVEQPAGACSAAWTSAIAWSGRSRSAADDPSAALTGNTNDALHRTSNTCDPRKARVARAPAVSACRGRLAEVELRGRVQCAIPLPSCVSTSTTRRATPGRTRASPNAPELVLAQRAARRAISDAGFASTGCNPVATTSLHVPQPATPQPAARRT